MRTYTNITYDKDRETIHLLQTLSTPGISIEDYRQSFYQIGKALGKLLNEKTQNEYGSTMLACASEDADWLARGVLEALSQKEVSLAVFWNERISLNTQTKLEYSPIIKSYIEPIEKCRTLIMVKSIISTSCVVKTQLTRLINKIQPQQVYIVAPVMYKDAQISLEKEFPPFISNKFKFLTFAIDTVKDGQKGIIPGIGGMIYPKLGLGDSHEKNKYMPILVKERVTT